MGLVAVGFSLAFQLSGLFSKLVAVEQTQGSFVYGMGFGLIAIFMFSIGSLLLIGMRKIRKRPTAMLSD